jgi:hypothetical protein
VKLRRGRAALLLGLGLELGLGAPAQGQEELRSLLGPELGGMPIRSDYRLTVVPDQQVAGQPTDLGWLQHDVSLSVPVWQGADDEGAASLRVRAQTFDTRAVFPGSGARFPEELWNIRLGGSYRHRFASGWIAGAAVTIGSPSDEPFAGMDELAISATAVLRIPRGERDAWLAFLDYSNTRDLLNGLPLPGVGYSYRPSERFTAVIATGFASVEYRPTEALTLMASYTVVRTVDVRVTYQVTRAVRLWAGFDWTSDLYLRADRANEDDRLFYYEKRVRLGATVGLARQLFVDVAVGYTFDRFYFEGEDYGDRHRNRIDVGDGPFGAARIGLRF